MKWFRKIIRKYIKKINYFDIIILLFSPYSPHCYKFAHQYKTLVQEFTDYADFYSINIINNQKYQKRFFLLEFLLF